MCITETFHTTYHGSSYSRYEYISRLTSHALLTCKSHDEEAGKHAGYNNELYMTWYCLVEGSCDTSEAITIQSLIFRKPKNRAKTVTL